MGKFLRSTPRQPIYNLGELHLQDLQVVCNLSHLLLTNLGTEGKRHLNQQNSEDWRNAPNPSLTPWSYHHGSILTVAHNPIRWISLVYPSLPYTTPQGGLCTHDALMVRTVPPPSKTKQKDRPLYAFQWHSKLKTFVGLPGLIGVVKPPLTEAPRRIEPLTPWVNF